MTRRGRPADAAGDGHARYLASVYRDVRLLTWSATDLQSMLDRVYWVYHSARPLFNLRCRSNFDAFRPEMLEPSDRDGASHIALLQHAPNLIHRMSWFGFWLHSRLPMPLKLHQNAEAQLGTGWIADHAWAEVMRIAPTWRIGEGGNYGCWFEVSAGSGIALNVGRSLRARNRAHLVAMLGANITRIFERPVQGKLHAWQTARMNGNWTNDPKTAPALFSNLSISDEVGLRQRYFENYPWRLEALVDVCTLVAGRYDTIQLMHEMCSDKRTARRHQACGIELVSCQKGCLGLRNRRFRQACIHGLPLRTGWDYSLPCRCNQSFGVLNCASTPTDPQVPPPPVVRSMHGSCLASHCWRVLPGLPLCKITPVSKQSE